MITTKNTMIVRVMDLDSLPGDVADRLDATCDHESVLFVRIDREFYNRLSMALRNHRDQVVEIIKMLASPDVSEFSFTAQRKPFKVHKCVEGGSG